MSLYVLKSFPLLYGGVHAAVFTGLAYFSYELYQRLSLKNAHSSVSRFFLSGMEWKPIIKSSEILEQLKAYKK